MAVRLQDIAKAAGLSKPTVSQVLNSKGAYNPQTRERVWKVARALGYQPNAAARATARGRFGSVALVLSAADPSRSNVSGGLVAGVAGRLEQEAMHMVLAVLPDEELTSEGFLPRILKELMSDGLLINYNVGIPSRMVELIEEHRLPSVWLNVKRDAYAVYPDDFGAGAEATRRLLALGHRRIAYVGYQPGGGAHYSQTDRREGYRQAMKEAGLAPQVLSDRVQDASVERQIANWAEVLRGPDRPMAVVGYSLGECRPLVRAADRLGLVIPRDLSVITFEGHLAFLSEGLAVMLIPEAEVGCQGVAMLLERIEAPNEPMASRAVGFGFEAGDSLAPPAP